MAGENGGSGEAGVDGYNAGYAEDLLERQLRDSGVEPPSLLDWNRLAAAGWGESWPEAPDDPAGGTLAAAPEKTPDISAGTSETVREGADHVPDQADLRRAAIAGAMVEALREYGHLAATVDPLGSKPPGHPMLTADFHGITRNELARVPAAAIEMSRFGDTALQALTRLETIYTGDIGYELDQMEIPAQRYWLVDYIEAGEHLKPLSREQSRRTLEWLTRVEELERSLHRAYIGKTRFSLEGLCALVPMIRAIIADSAAKGGRQAILGMAHRGRLNVLAHVIGLPYSGIFAEFEEQISRGLQTALPEHGSGDVKYHVGGKSLVEEDGVSMTVSLAPNPSHLEHVNPVVTGMARAVRDRLTGGDGTTPDTAVLPLLIHGDASFAGQGVVAETLNLCRLSSYETGGTIHIIANNQLGFTTLPGDGRSTRYASDLALGFRMPVIHVNADNPDACLAVAKLAVDYRFSFGEDIVIDLVGYRKYGHNEGDEPGYTQPRMYQRIAKHPSVRKLYARQLSEQGIVPDQEAAAMAEAAAAELAEARQSVIDAEPHSEDPPGPNLEWLTAPAEAPIDTSIGAEKLRSLNTALHETPEGFRLFGKLARQLKRREESMESGIDWAHAEALALAGLLDQGVSVRLTGEDTERGTFSHRHAVLHEAESGERHVPLADIAGKGARFEISNSPLSEVAALGFEYGYSTVAQDTLVAWEAQYGDFVNVGQAMIDQFVVSGREKWGQESRLTLLLPHGHEGAGPEHSSGRVERFLQLAAEQNIRVANCTTPAQYFHLLRWQALRPTRRPLVIMTPKSLLRNPLARSGLSELSEGSFQPVISGVGAAGRRTRRVILCTGKIYYDLIGAPEVPGDIAIIRIEMLYPFPEQALKAALEPFSESVEVCWVQEEPRNMGAWTFARPLIREASGRDPLYIGRYGRASPAEGYSGRHVRRQKAIIAAALG
ncbi:MAG: 2-oxoglutarate dehydrogenase E1 component [Gemmatimonadetes bacterium]|nr:2-oxoglutarate dehydrogenase E1 component [Gemmatimonadota bacterium]